MKRFALLAALLGACGSDPLTWGDVSEEIAVDFCDSVAKCGYSADTPVCIEHAAWHLCKPNHSCLVPVNLKAFLEADNACHEALNAPGYSDPASTECYLLGFWGQMPEGCDPLLDLDPGPQD